jgi:hypothetical protein
MGRIIFIGCSLFLHFFSSASSFQIKWSFSGVASDFIRPSAIQLTVDGIEKPLSGCFSQAEVGTFSDSLSLGQHHLTIAVWIRQEDHWEKHLVENDYEMDAVYDSMVQITCNQLLFLHFNISTHRIVAQWQPLVLQYPKLLDLSIRSVFTEIPEGFDLTVRYRIYGNDDLLFTSQAATLSTMKWIKCQVPQSTTDLKIVLEVFYNGFWEEHLAFFGYQMDAVYFLRGNYKKEQIFTVKSSIASGQFKVKRHKKRVFF